MLQLPRTHSVFCRFWDDECVVYQRITDETHLLEGLGAEIFKSISQQPSTKQQLLHSLKELFDIPPDLDMEECLDKLIVQYQALSLLEVTEINTA